MLRTVLVLVVAGLLSACSSTVQAYGGAARPDNQVATIIPENSWNRARTSIAPTGTGEIQARVANQRLSLLKSQFTVLPGQHNLLVVYRNDNTPYKDYELQTRPVTLALNAQAGRTYAIRAQPNYVKDRIDVRIFAVDVGSRQTVAQVQVPQSHIHMDDGATDIID